MVPSCCGYRALAVLASILALLGQAGCGSGGRVPVHGSVSYDGTPVENGTISFLSTGGGANATNAGAEIRDGKYAIDAERGPKPGKYKVEIYWNRKTGKMVPTPGDPGVKMAETKQVLPPKYNRQTTLTADITVGSDSRDFDLKP